MITNQLQKNLVFSFILPLLIVGCKQAADVSIVAEWTPTIVPIPKPTPSAMNQIHFYLADINDAIQTTNRQLERLRENERIIPTKIDKIQALLVEDLNKLNNFQSDESEEKIQFHVLKQICIGLGLQYDWFTNKKKQNQVLIENTMDKMLACEDIRDYLDITIQNMKGTPTEEHDQFFGMIKTTIDEVKKITETNEEFLTEFQKGPRSDVDSAATEQYFEDLIKRFGNMPAAAPTPPPVLTVQLDLPPEAKPFEMIFVPPSITTEEKTKDEITKGFYLGKYEVTQAHWQAVMGSNPSHRRDHPDLPVDQVSWNDCQKFLEILSTREQVKFRLPTENEWLYAFEWKRNDSDSTRMDSVIDEVAWYRNNADGRPHEVGLKHPHPGGFFDLEGNVFEWCRDPIPNCFHDTTSPFPHRIIRGGSWDSGLNSDNIHAKDSMMETYRTISVGFRVLKEL